MPDLQRGMTFVDGVPNDETSAKIHALVDAATILPASISGKPAATPVLGDLLGFHQNSLTRIAKCTVAQLLALQASNAAAGTPSLRSLGTGATHAAAGNDARFPANLTGLRKGRAGLPDIVAAPQDLTFPGIGVLGTVVNWALATHFNIDLTAGDRTISFSNVGDGQTIILIAKLVGNTLTLPVLTNGTITPTPGKVLNVYTFSKSGPWLVGQVT